jgi:transcriptional regulator with XRE-family HTH domain
MDDLEKKLAARLGQAIRAQRTRLGLSQAELAESLDSSVEYVSLMERGQRLPALGTLVRAAKALDVAPGDLLANITTLGERDPAAALVRAVPQGAKRAVIAMLRGVIREYSARRERGK